ncbi:4-coumarate-CoA ligase-like protein [Phyllosticta citrichinensis]|uniref:4-coumarate-CoA ligase-like protein n=1 Tax=Phyllosticta citrichinensis TaxID=1130410 RepID=A0ABR1Y8D9_9PEZI
MATVFEQTAEGIIYKCPDSWPLPDLDVLTLLFESELSYAREYTPVSISCANSNHFITKSEARDCTKRTAHTLRHNYGIGESGPGKDVVCSVTTGHHLLSIAFYGVIAAGGVYSAASPAGSPSDVAKQMRDGDAKLLICNDDTRPLALAAAQEVGLPEDRVLVIPTGGEWELRSAKDKQNVVGLKKMDWQRITDPGELEDTTIVLIYSSGTTGSPKGVRISHRNIVAEAVTSLDPWKAYNKKHRPNFEYRTIAHLPPSHISAIQGYLVNPMYIGGTAFWMAKFDFGLFLEYCKKYRITSFFTAPPIWLGIARHPLVTDQFASLEHAVSGGAPMNKELQMAASRKLGRPGSSTNRTLISQTWGLTETTGAITLLPYGETDETGSVSCLTPGHEARIVADDGTDAPPGTAGEMWVRGPVVSKGYHNNSAADAEAFVQPGGWFRSGDVMAFRDGKFYMVDRRKELIKYRTHTVPPAELEALLLAHPVVADAAVIGVPLDYVENNDDDDVVGEAAGQVPRAYVVATAPEAWGSDTADEIVQFVAEQVADYKRLRGGVVFVEKIPRAPSGKILRRELRALAAAEREQRR